MRSLVDEKPHRMPIDGHFDGEIVRRARLDDVARHRVVVRVDQRFVQIEDERFALHQRQSMARHRRQREHIVFDGLILCKLTAIVSKLNKKTLTVCATNAG